MSTWGRGMKDRQEEKQKKKEKQGGKSWASIISTELITCWGEDQHFLQDVTIVKASV